MMGERVGGEQSIPLRSIGMSPPPPPRVLIAKPEVA